MPSETSAVNAAYIEARMKQFKLVDMREQYQELIRVASEQSMTYEDFLIMLLQAEETGKKRRQAERLTDAANFDSDKRLSDIDYRFNPNLDADKIQSLGRLEFMDNHENIIIIGPPGVGKSMIATGIGRNACLPFLILSFWTFDTIAVTRYTYDMAMMDQAVKDRCSGQLAGE